MARIVPHTVKVKDGAEVLLRCAEVDDAAAVLAFADHSDRTSLHNVSQPGERKMTIEQEREWLQKGLDDEVSINILAVEPGSGEIIGFINFKGNDRRRVAHWGVFGITVHAEHRSRGIGAALIQALLDWARASEKIEKVVLQVFEPNHHARALYVKMGFKEESRRARLIKLEDGTYVDDIEMGLWVK